MRLLTAIVSLALSPLASAQEAEKAKEAPGAKGATDTKHEDTCLVFADVHVIPMDRDTVLKHQTVVVRGTRIVAMPTGSKIRLMAD